MDSLPSQSVAIDGHAVRRIREEKRLTQLYVAKVVGVTTDTVSRWENNRYPTIRRDNALGLADALEVELADILKKETPPAPAPVKSGGSGRSLGFVVVGVALLVVVVLFYRNRMADLPVLTAGRTVPVFAAPGSRILVKVDIASEKDLKGMILKERFPAGWKLLDAVPGASSVEPGASGARWIFRAPKRQISVYYMLRVAADAGADSTPTISGEVIANPDGRHSAVTIENSRAMQVKPLHWADVNGNGIIDDLEILDVSEMTEQTGPLDLGWDLIETLWEAGGYRWDAGKTAFVPVGEENG